jgi:hypothetical protein
LRKELHPHQFAEWARPFCDGVILRHLVIPGMANLKVVPDTTGNFTSTPTHILLRLVRVIMSVYVRIIVKLGNIKMETINPLAKPASPGNTPTLAKSPVPVAQLENFQVG